MKKYRVYVDHYNVYVTDKEMPKFYEFFGDFDTMKDAEEFADRTIYQLMIDRDLVDESGWSWVGDDYDNYTFDFNELIGG